MFIYMFVPGYIPRFLLVVFCSGHQMYDVLVFRKEGASTCPGVVHLYTFVPGIKCLFTCLFRGEDTHHRRPKVGEDCSSLPASFQSGFASF